MKAPLIAEAMDQGAKMQLAEGMSNGAKMKLAEATHNGATVNIAEAKHKGADIVKFVALGSEAENVGATRGTADTALMNAISRVG